MRLIAEHDSSIPFFLNYDLHIAHEPIELPRTYFDRQQALVNASGVADYVHRRTTYQGMVSFMDEIVGNITAALHTKQMYDDTIIVYSSDNGGPSWTASHHLAASNWPLRGSKNTDLEGGVRVGAFISGGFMQTHAQANIGRSLSGIIHIADWYSTLCALAGVSPEDDRAALAGLPSVDSINMWPYLSGQRQDSPRASAQLSRTAYLEGRFKLLTGDVSFACWGSEVYPNASAGAGPKFGPYGSPCNNTLHCGAPGCLFDVVSDVEERIDLAGHPDHASTVEAMRAELVAANRRHFSPQRGSFSELACEAAARAGGYWAPFVE